MEYYIGVDVGGSKINAILATYDGTIQILDREKRPTREGDTPVLKRIQDCIDSLLDRRGLAASALSGIGIVLPGPMEKNSGRNIECPNIPELTGLDIGGHFENLYGVPVGADNDAHAATLAEARSGAGQGYDNFVYLCLGTGVGCGIVINGELYKGADGAAGELSHIVFPGYGELYKLASGKALRELHGIESETLQQCCEDQDPAALDALDRFVEFLGTGIGTVITLFNPQAVVVGGGMASLGDFLLKPVEAKARQTAFSISGASVVFLQAKHRVDAEAIGAVHVCRDRMVARRSISR